MSADEISRTAENIKQHLENNDSQSALQSLMQEIDTIERSPASEQKKASEEALLFKQIREQNKGLAAHGFPVLEVDSEGKHFSVSKDEFEMQSMDFDWTSYSKYHQKDQPGEPDPTASPATSEIEGKEPLTGKVEHNTGSRPAESTGPALASDRYQPAPEERAPAEATANRFEQAPERQFVARLDSTGFVDFDQRQNYHGPKDIYSGLFTSDHFGHQATANLWFPDVPEFQPTPGHPVAVKGFVQGDSSGYGDNKQFNINAYQGRLEIDPRTGRPEFVGHLYDSGRLITGPDGSQTNPYWSVRIPLTGRQAATSPTIMNYGGY